MKKMLLPAVLILLVTVGCLYAPVTKIPPAAYIDMVSPINSTCGETVTFTGHGIDPDGTIGAYSWRSSRDGDLSTAASFSTSTLTSGTHTIWLRVQDNDGQWSPEVSATVIVVAVVATKPVINAFSAIPESINAGGSSTLSWSVSGCTTVNIDQAIGNVALSGTRVVYPTKTTTYTLTAINEVGTSTATAQVVLTATPINMLDLYPIAAESGQVRRDGYVSLVPLVGDTQSGTAIQAFLSFDISMIPADATITAATLNLFTYDLVGSPFDVLGRLYIFDCKYSQLSSNAYAGGVILPGALYSTTVFTRQPISTDQLLSAIETRLEAGSNRFQIRIQFEKQQIYRGSSANTYNELADYISFDPVKTKLTIEYQY